MTKKMKKRLSEFFRDKMKNVVVKS